MLAVDSAVCAVAVVFVVAVVLAVLGVVGVAFIVDGFLLSVKNMVVCCCLSFLSSCCSCFFCFFIINVFLATILLCVDVFLFCFFMLNCWCFVTFDSLEHDDVVVAVVVETRKRTSLGAGD